MTNKYWVSPVKEWKELDVNTGHLILSETEKYLQATIDTSLNIDKHSYNIMGLCYIVITVCVTYLTGGYGFNALNLTAITAMCIVLYSLYCLHTNSKSYRLSILGQDPKHLLQPQFIEGYKDNEQYINMLFCLIENGNAKIENNNKVNDKRQLILEKSKKALYFLPLSVIPSISYQFYLFAF